MKVTILCDNQQPLVRPYLQRWIEQNQRHEMGLLDSLDVLPGGDYRKSTPQDSGIDPSLSLAETFHQTRLADPHRFPTFCCLHGHT